jgi:cell wall-associated NlpC family hydrolase
MGQLMSRRLSLLACAALLSSAAAAHAGPQTPSSWAAPQIRAVAAAGLMGATNVQTFRGSDPLTAQALENLVFDLEARLAPPPEAGDPGSDPGAPAADPTVTDPTVTDPTLTDPTATTTTTGTTTTPATAAPPAAPKQVRNGGRPVQMWELDARLVGALGLNDAASTFAKSARAAGLEVPSRFGTEVVARLLGLRLDHPANEDALELRPQDAASRAEAAYSAARILTFSAWQVSSVAQAAQEFSLPSLTQWQTRILDTAVAHIGMPYIWGGESDTTESPFGVTSRGGYDCSGFVWRVYKEQWYPGEVALASTLRGRTTYQMSGEVPASRRIPFARLQPADVIFFGDKGPRSKPSQVGHMGIYLGNGWFIHSSEYGVAVASLNGWYRSEFAWARRPLAEAGLSS